MNLLVDEGGWRIEYREPILGGHRASFHKVSTLSQAVAEFNVLERTSGFDTPMRITRVSTMGDKTHVYTQDGRYSVPRLIGGTMMDTDRPQRTRRHRRSSTRG
jgi:hypothetical protein